MLKKGITLLIISFLFSITTYGNICGFEEVKKTQYDKDLLHIYRHTSAGLEVLWIENDDERKGFTLGVKTPTTDNTGVNHIIEHTVFTGSEAYPYPGLFFDASSTYPNLFMNALTSGDMTIFPFVTSYDTCYKSLLNIYLDSIFCPNMLREYEGFYEEGFNYNPETEAFGGVVYNEMKGAAGSIDRMIFRSIRKAVYKDTHYAYDSGGDPAEIPKLNYEDFINTYYKYYYPKNMKIILYGKLPIKEILSTIENYLKEKKTGKDAVSLYAEPYRAEKYQYYAVLPKEQKPCIIKSFVIQKKLSAKEAEMLDLWIEAYLLNPQSSFQKQVQKAGFTNVKIFKDEELTYPIYSIVLQDIPFGQTKHYEKMLEQMIGEMCSEKSQNKLLEKSTIEKAKMVLLSEDQNNLRGIEIAESILDAWAHEREIDQYFIKKQNIKKITKLGAWEQTLFKEAEAYTIELSAVQQTAEDPLRHSSLSKEAWQKITEKLAVWRNKEQNSCLRGVALEELVLSPKLTVKVKTDEDTAYITTKISGNLDRSQLYFNTSHICQEKLPYLFLYAYFLEECAKEITPFYGLLETKCIVFNNAEGYSPFLKVTLLSPKESNRHGEFFLKAREKLLAQDETWYKHQLGKFVTEFREGWSANILGALSYLDMGYDKGSKRYLYEAGYPLYAFGDELSKKSAYRWIDEIKQMDALLYNQKGLVVATTVSSRAGNYYEKIWKKIVRNLPNYPVKEPGYVFNIQPQKSVLINDTQVDYIFLQYAKEERLDGRDYLAAAYLTRYYLNPSIRVQLGAYGAGCQLSSPQTVALFTYRDPDYRTSMNILKKIPEYLQKADNHADLEAAKVEALTKVHSHFKLQGTPMDKADANEYNLLIGINKNDIVNLQYEIIHASINDIQKKSSLFKEILEKGALGIATKTDSNINGDCRIYHFK